MPVLSKTTEGTWLFWCPGCQCAHSYDLIRWQFNGDLEKPTFTPSLLVRSGHYIPDHKGDCWCTYNEKAKAEGREPADFSCSLCHLFVEKGQIQYLNDCTHELRGKTVPMEEL